MLTTSRYVKLIDNEDNEILATSILEMYHDKLSKTNKPSILTLIALCNGINYLKEIIQMRSVEDQIKFYQNLFMDMN